MGLNIDDNVQLMVTVWAETMLFGIYTVLFFESMLITWVRREGRPSTSHIFTFATIVMYLISASRIIIGIQLVVEGQLYYSDNPYSYFHDQSWEHALYTVLNCSMTWVGQALLIYRCYFVWRQNVLVIVPSIMLYCAAFTIGVFCNVIWATPGAVLSRSVLATKIPFELATDFVTTGLIVYYLVRKHQQTRTIGLHINALSFYDIAFVMLESTGLYTVVVTVILVLHILGSNIKPIFLGISVPTLGIAFSLLSVRLHRANVNTRNADNTTKSSLHMNLCETENSDQPEFSSQHELTTIRSGT